MIEKKVTLVNKKPKSGKKLKVVLNKPPQKNHIFDKNLKIKYIIIDKLKSKYV
jgi:hypothetical protein